MELYHVVILSIIEGVTEFLPISSTAHLVLASHVLSIPQDPFLETFQIAIQMGAILAVLFLYFKKIISDKSLVIKSCVAFLPTGLLGFIFLDYIRFFLANPIVPAIALFIGGLAIIGIEIFLGRHSTTHNLQPKTLASLSYKDSLIIGLIQSVSLIPGVSRAAASIYGGLALKMDRKAATEFSFLLAIPTIVVASLFELLTHAPAFGRDQFAILGIGIVVSFVVAAIVIKWFITYVSRKGFFIFGVYRIILSILYYWLFLR